jgi:hypothetical protein
VSETIGLVVETLQHNPVIVEAGLRPAGYAELPEHQEEKKVGKLFP